MEFTGAILNTSTLLLIIAVSLSMSGWIICCVSFFNKISNYSGNKFILLNPKAFLVIFLGSVIFSLLDIYDKNWASFFIQLLVSILNLCIYITHSKTYKKRLELEKR